MTNKSKIYLAIILISLLFAAGSLAWQKLRSVPTPPQQEEPRQILAQEQEELPPRDAPRGWVKPAAPAGEGETPPPPAFLDEPLIKAFNDEIMAAIGEVTPEDFATGAAQDKYFNNPQIEKILLKYSKDPAFIQTVQQILADKDIEVESGAARGAGHAGNK